MTSGNQIKGFNVTLTGMGVAAAIAVHRNINRSFVILTE